MNCTRRPGSEWTNCTCPDCRAEQRRKAKHTRNGIKTVADQRPAAWARVCAWVEAGYSMGVIASLAGVGTNAAFSMVRDARSGRQRPIHHATARRIMAAPRQPIEGEGWVPSIGTVRRLQALTVMGWSMANLATRTDVAESTLHALRDPKHRQTRPQFAAAVARLYSELSMQKGPCRYAATRAIRKGWAPPLAWDDGTIDDPATQPDLGTGARRLSNQRIDVDDIAWFLDVEPMATAQRIGERFGITKDAVQMCARRAERRDLLARLARNAEVAA